MSAELFKLIGYIQDDLRKSQAQLVTVRAMLAALNLDERPRVPCPECGIDRRTKSLLKEHLRNVHNREVS